MYNEQILEEITVREGINFSQVKQVRKLLLEQLVINGGFQENVGLINGRLGLSLAMFTLGGQPGMGYLAGFANDLLEEAFMDIDGSVSPGYDNGAVGIAAYFHLIEKYGFASVSRAEVLEEVDLYIHKYIAHSGLHPADLNEGSLGLIYYLMLKLSDEELHNSLDNSFLTREMLIACIDELAGHFGNALAKFDVKTISLRIHAYNLLRRLKNDIYPQPVASIVKMLEDEDLEQKYREAVAGSSNEAGIQLIYLCSVYCSVIGKTIPGLELDYQKYTLLSATQYHQAPSLQGLNMLLDMIINGLENGMYNADSDISPTQIVNRAIYYLNDPIITGSVDYSLHNGLGKLLFMVQSLLKPQAYQIYKEVIYLQI